MEDCVWFVPFGSTDGRLQSAYAPDSSAQIAQGEPFTVALERLQLGHGHKESLMERLLGHGRDIVVMSSAALGSSPQPDRVHYYSKGIDPSQPLMVHDLLSDEIYLCDRYSGTDHLFVRLSATMIDIGSEHGSVAQAFQNLASSAGAVFPVVMPYTAMADGVINAVEKLWAGREKRLQAELISPLELRPPNTPNAKTLQKGRYVVFAAESDGKASQGVDGTQFKLFENGALARLDGTTVNDVSYAVFRIDLVNEPSIDTLLDKVVSQDVATLLTGLQNDRSGTSTNPTETSLGFLSDTMRAYNNFKDLQHYRDLLNKPNRTQAEDDWMKKTAMRDDLKPFISPLPQTSQVPSA